MLQHIGPVNVLYHILIILQVVQVTTYDYYNEVTDTQEVNRILLTIYKKETNPEISYFSMQERILCNVRSTTRYTAK